VLQAYVNYLATLARRGKKELRMGIFDDEARRREAERARESRADFTQQQERNKIAQDIADDLQNDEASRPGNYGASLIIQLNVLSLRVRDRELKITCNGSDEFYLGDERTGFQSRIVNSPQVNTVEGMPISRRKMAGRVLDWLSAHRIQ
jgi:hypothetical protein